jgi:hypothetical protein
MDWFLELEFCGIVILVLLFTWGKWEECVDCKHDILAKCSKAFCYFGLIFFVLIFNFGWRRFDVNAIFVYSVVTLGVCLVEFIDNIFNAAFSYKKFNSSKKIREEQIDSSCSEEVCRK